MPIPEPPVRLTPAEAAQLHLDLAADGLWPMWFVTAADPAFPGCHVARVHTINRHGGVWLPNALVADTLAELVAMMPPGLKRETRAPLDPLDMLEAWS